MERISVREGDIPVIFVAPHGVDDMNTDFLVDKISLEMDAFAVINRGWKRSEHFDYFQDKADCNNFLHVHEDVVKEEFLLPIMRMVSKIKKNLDNRVFIFNIHGCSNDVRKKANDNNLDLILGYGEGSPSSYTCDLKMKDSLAYFLERENFIVYEGKKGGKYAARSQNNLNQLFRLWYPDFCVHSVQIEIVKELREDEGMLQITSDGLMGAIDDLLLFDDTESTVKRSIKYI